MRAKVSAAKILFYANNPDASKPLAERNRQRGIENALLSPELMVQKEILRLQKVIADLKAQQEKEETA